MGTESFSFWRRLVTLLVSLFVVILEFSIISGVCLVVNGILMKTNIIFENTQFHESIGWMIWTWT